MAVSNVERVSVHGYDVKLCNGRSFERNKCPLCNRLLRQPIQTERGEVACEQCYKKAYMENAGICPIDKEPSDGKVNRDKAKEKDVLALICWCKFDDLGCDWKGEVRSVDEHEKGCIYRSEKCQFCLKTMQSSKLPSHQKQCPELVSLGCPYTGCTFKSDDGEKLKEHLLDYILIHSHLQMKEQREQEQRIISLEAMQHILEMERDEKEREAAVLRKELILTQQTMQQALSNQHQQEEQISMLENQLKSLPQENETKSRQKSNNESYDIDSLSTNVSLLNKQISDLDLRQQLFENTSFDGKLVWKIDKVEARMQQARSGRVTALHSAPAFSDRHGYKFCARLYLNGDGLGRGTHVSLFFVLMRSEFDSLLVWPFNHPVKFRLVNQQRLESDVVESFSPDQQSISFKKPTKDMNVASGCPRFISIESFKNGGFINDDCIFIEIDVGTDISSSA